MKFKAESVNIPEKLLELGIIATYNYMRRGELIADGRAIRPYLNIEYKIHDNGRTYYIDEVRCVVPDFSKRIMPGFGHARPPLMLNKQVQASFDMFAWYWGMLTGKTRMPGGSYYRPRITA